MCSVSQRLKPTKYTSFRKNPLSVISPLLVSALVGHCHKLEVITQRSVCWHMQYYVFILCKCLLIYAVLCLHTLQVSVDICSIISLCSASVCWYMQYYVFILCKCLLIYAVLSLYSANVCWYVQYYVFIICKCLLIYAVLYLYTLQVSVDICSTMSLYSASVCWYMQYYVFILCKVCWYMQYYIFILCKCLLIYAVLYIYTLLVSVDICSIMSLYSAMRN